VSESEYKIKKGIRMKKNKHSDEELTTLEETFITGGIVVRTPLKNFEKLVNFIKEELPDSKLVYRKVSVGNLYIHEKKPSCAEACMECAAAR